jgi:hypothetical protein
MNYQQPLTVADCSATAVQLDNKYEQSCPGGECAALALACPEVRFIIHFIFPMSFDV